VLFHAPRAAKNTHAAMHSQSAAACRRSARDLALAVVEPADFTARCYALGARCAHYERAISRRRGAEWDPRLVRYHAPAMNSRAEIRRRAT
jgi:hypothetical protein